MTEGTERRHGDHRKKRHRDRCAAAQPLYEPAAAQVGIELGGSVNASSSAPNYTAECLQMVGEGVITEARAREIAKRVLRDNAIELYHLDSR